MHSEVKWQCVVDNDMKTNTVECFIKHLLGTLFKSLEQCSIVLKKKTTNKNQGQEAQIIKKLRKTWKQYASAWFPGETEIFFNVHCQFQWCYIFVKTNLQNGERFYKIREQKHL